MISWRDSTDGLRQGSLFAVFAALSRGEAWSFPALRPHQREPWHAFTVQIGALALIRAGLDEPPADEAAWQRLLLALTPGWPDGEAWALVVDDWSRPALLQPPLPAPANRADYKNRLPTPDALDMLVTAKNHDVKQERMAGGSDEDWLFALVTLQTAAAYGGAKTYGASRMNGKTGSRLIARVRPGTGAAKAFNRDVRLLARSAGAERDAKALLWIEPTDGRTSVALHTLAPSLYIDCARRIRLRRDGGRLEACYATSDSARVNADASAGVTGDPFAPIKPTRDASVTPKRESFGYKGITKLLGSDLPILAIIQKEDEKSGLSIGFSALVRRGGTDTNTDGFFDRSIPVSYIEELEQYGPEVIHDRLADVAKTRSDEAALASGKLKTALYTLLQGAPSEPGPSKRLQIRFNDKTSEDRARNWLAQFDREVDVIFFDGLFWSEVTEKPGNHRLLWRRRLRVMAGQVFDRAAEAAPRTQMRRVRAVARARSLLDGQMGKWLREVADGE